MSKQPVRYDELASAGRGEPLSVLLIDDEADSLLPILTQKLERLGFRFSKETSAGRALGAIAANGPDLVLLDLHFPGDDRHGEGTTGGRLLPDIRHRFPQVAVLVFTTRLDDMDIPLETFGEQPQGYFAKPDLNNKQWPGMLAASMRAAVEAGRQMRVPVSSDDSLLVGSSPAMREVAARVRSAARNGLSVLIIGEIGTGKALVAEAIHELSGLMGAFVQVDCGEEPDEGVLETRLFGLGEPEGEKTGAIEEATAGTLFLSGLDRLPLPLQDRLLHVLNTGRVRRKGATDVRGVDLRVIAATGHGLADLVADGVLREALAYRLAQFLIQVPSVRERLQDLPELFRLCIRQANQRLNLRVSDVLRPEVKEKLEAHPWYGNLREFEAAVLRAVANTSSNILLPQDFEFVPFGKTPGREAPLSSLASRMVEQEQAGTEDSLTLGLTDRLESLPLEARYPFLRDLAQDTQTAVLIEFIGRLRQRTGRRVTHKALAAELDPLLKGESDFAKVRQFVCGRVKLTQLDINQ